MKTSAANGKVLVIDPNVFFAKRLARSLAELGYEVVHCAEPAYALTMVEWDMPAAILCSLSVKQSDGFEVPSILQADAKTRHIPVIAVGDCRKHSHLETLRAGYVDLLDRRLGAEEMAAHLSSLILSLRQGFQPTQMLQAAETRLNGHLSLMDLPSVMQMLEQSRQTGALHVNSAGVDGIIFFVSGEPVHAESGDERGDAAVVHLVKECHRNREGTYKFVGGTPSGERTVNSPLTRLILDALYEVDDEKQKADGAAATGEPPEVDTTAERPTGEFPAPENPLAAVLDLEPPEVAMTAERPSSEFPAPENLPAAVLDLEPPAPSVAPSIDGADPQAGTRGAPIDTEGADLAVRAGDAPPSPGKDEPHE